MAPSTEVIAEYNETSSVMSNITSNDRGVVQPTNRLVQLPDRLVQHTRRLVPSEDNQKADKGIVSSNLHFFIHVASK